MKSTSVPSWGSSVFKGKGCKAGAPMSRIARSWERSKRDILNLAYFPSAAGLLDLHYQLRRLLSPRFRKHMGIRCNACAIGHGEASSSKGKAWIGQGVECTDQNHGGFAARNDLGRTRQRGRILSINCRGSQRQNSRQAAEGGSQSPAASQHHAFHPRHQAKSPEVKLISRAATHSRQV